MSNSFPQNPYLAEPYINYNEFGQGGHFGRPPLDVESPNMGTFDDISSDEYNDAIEVQVDVAGTVRGRSRRGGSGRGRSGRGISQPRYPWTRELDEILFKSWLTIANDEIVGDEKKKRRSMEENKAIIQPTETAWSSTTG
ncbi:hypothetical protein M5689_001007 [Euphorbia peplus]|nr:hypothetical protein M5689_001007 [Euphorbia peplus]